MKVIKNNIEIIEFTNPEGFEIVKGTLDFHFIVGDVLYECLDTWQMCKLLKYKYGLSERSGVSIYGTAIDVIREEP